MARCDEIGLLLGAFEDGELEPHEMQEVARHLASCKSCEDTLAGYSTLSRLLRDAVPTPSLDGFAHAVQARIEQLRPPLRVRIGRWFEEQRERFGSSATVALAMAAAAIVTVVVTTPLAQNMVGAGGHTMQVAARAAGAIAGHATQSSRALASAHDNEPGTIISKLETSNPNVAVWSGPNQDTTVIWLPDQQR